MSVKKAIVLAAGLGTRLRPFTSITPKPLMTVWGEPLLKRIVDMLRGWGVEEIAVNCHYLHEQIEKWCAENGCKASYEPEILGTGGVLNPLRDWIGKDDFYLVNGDIVLENAVDLSAATPRPTPRGTSVIARALVTKEGPRTIEVEPEGNLVTCWKSPDAGWDGTFTYCGCTLLKPEILDYVEPTGFSTIIQAYERAAFDGKFVQTVEPKDMLWSDAGRIDDLIALNRTEDDNAFNDFPQIAAALEAMKLPDDAEVKFLGSRGSERCFFAAGDGIIILYNDETRTENGKYAGHARWLKAAGVKVPEVLVDRPDLKLLVLENAGSTDLLERVKRPGADRLGDYAKVVEHLAKFNALAVPDSLDLVEPFSPELWRWEQDLFVKYCLAGRFRREMTDDLRKEFDLIAAKLEAEPKALVHRDFQSTNVVFKNDDFKFIDFQGMRRGPAVYDLASLIYDPYISLKESERKALAALYGKVSGRGDLGGILPFAAVERLMQALGAYGRLASVGQPQFTKHVLPALEMLLAAADEAGLDAIGAMAEELIALEERPKYKHPDGCKCGECDRS